MILPRRILPVADEQVLCDQDVGQALSVVNDLLSFHGESREMRTRRAGRMSWRAHLRVARRSGLTDEVERAPMPHCPAAPLPHRDGRSSVKGRGDRRHLMD